MPNLLDIRRRIKSVKNTQQITKAMKMVSAAKLKRAQDRVVTARPFANKMTEVLGELAKRTDEDFHHPLLDLRGDERYLLVLVTADKGLCGAFNTNLIKAAQAFIRDNPDKTNRDAGGRSQGPRFLSPSTTRRSPANIIGLTGKGRVEFSEALEVARDMIKRFTEDKEIDKVFLIYNEFKSVLSAARRARTAAAGLASERRRAGSEVATAASHSLTTFTNNRPRRCLASSCRVWSRRRSFARCSSRLLLNRARA